MKLKIGEIQLKTLLTEENYNSGFNKIQNGDIFSVVTDGKTYEGKVVDKYSTQIIVQIAGKNFVITNNSLEGDVLKSNEIKDGKRGPTSVTKNVKTIIIRRNGNTVATLLPNDSSIPSDGPTKPKGGNNQNKPTDPADNIVIRPFYKEAYENCLSNFQKIVEDCKLTVKCGELITKNEIGENTITVVEFHVRKIYKNDIVKAVITELSGVNADKYKQWDGEFVKLSISKSLELTENGVNMIIKSHSSSDEIILNGVYEIEVGAFDEASEPTFDDLMQDKSFRDLMLKNPSLIGQISGELSKGVIPASEIISKLGLNKDYYTKGKKVKFTYSGASVRQGQRLSLISGKEYIGLFSTAKTIRLTGEKRGESLLIKLKKKIKDQIYEVGIEFNKIQNGQQTTSKLGDGVVQITDVNFR